MADDLGHAAASEPRIAFEGEEADTARGLVGAGLGVSLLPATASSLSDPTVVAIRITSPKAARTVGIAWMTDRPVTPPTAAFRDFALTYAGRLTRGRSSPARRSRRRGRRGSPLARRPPAGRP